MGLCRDAVPCILNLVKATFIRLRVRQGAPVNELTRITCTAGRYTITTGWDVTLARGATRDAALTALFHRGFTPQVAVASVNVAKVDGAVTVAGLPAD